MTNELSKVNSEFRQLCDLLLFSDRTDLDVLKFKSLLDKDPCHSKYLWERFKKATDIFWEEGAKLWHFRFKILIDAVDKPLIKDIEAFLEKRMFSVIRLKAEVSSQYNIEYLQFCKVKYEKNYNLSQFKTKLVELTPQLTHKKVISIVEDFIPCVFKDMDEFLSIVANRIVVSDSNFHLLLALETHGVPLTRNFVINLANDLLVNLPHSDKHARACFVVLNDVKVLEGFKKIYSPLHREKILSLVQECAHFYNLEDNKFRILKNFIKLDPTLADSLASIYTKKILSRKIHHKRANADRVIRLIKSIPQVSSKKLLALLVSNNQMSDVRHIIKVFPELKKLAIFA